MARKMVTFSAQYTTYIEVKEGQSTEDATADIDIPENDECQYNRDTFQLVKIQDDPEDLLDASEEGVSFAREMQRKENNNG